MHKDAESYRNQRNILYSFRPTDLLGFENSSKKMHINSNKNLSRKSLKMSFVINFINP